MVVWESVTALPITVTLFELLTHSNSPTLSDNCNDVKCFLFNLLDQKGIREQCDEPVAGSSSIVDWGVKYLDTKSELVPLEVTTTPPVSAR